MPKISKYDEQTAPDEDSYLIIQIEGYNYRVKMREIPYLQYSRKMMTAASDLIGGNDMEQNYPFDNVAIGAGTIAQIASESNHPGIWRITSAAGANSGNSILLGADGVLIGGGEYAGFVSRFPNTASLKARMGFYDENTLTANPADGVWIDVSGTTVSGKTANNSAVSTTPSSYVMAGNTWYYFLIVVNSGATTVTFYVYSAAGALLWSDSLSTNIPTTAGRETRFGCSAIWTAASSTNIMDVDLLSYRSSDQQVR